MRVLVTGVGGLIGSNVGAAAVQQSWETIGCYRSRAVELDGVRAIAVDVADRHRCVATAMEFDPDVIVHAVGGAELSRFELEPRLAELDYLATEHTIAAARAVRARYVLVSCDLVYGGGRPAGSCFSESDAPAPVNAFGRSKLACEQATMRANLPWLIVRPADVYGVNLSRPLHPAPMEQGVWEGGMREAGAELDARDGGAGEVGVGRGVWEGGAGEAGAELDARDGGASEVGAGRGVWEGDMAQARIERGVWERSGLALRLVKRLRAGTVVPAPRGLWRSPTYAWDFAQRSCELIAQGCEGVYNMGGAVPLGRYEWLELLAEAFGCAPELVQNGTVEGFLQVCGEDPWLELPSNTALSGEKASAAIGSPAVAPERGLQLMREQLRRMLQPVRGLAR